jgi:hypothetical protein
MWIRTRPASASISLEARAPANDHPAAMNEIVSFELLPTNERDHLDLDTGEVFQDYSYARIHKKEQKLIRARITIRTVADEVPDQKNAMCYTGEFGGDDFHHPATIFFDVFLAPMVFRELADNTKNGLLPETITFELMNDPSFIFKSSENPDNKRAFEYGWEPDGSGVIWHNKENENRRIPIDSVRFDYAVAKPRYDEQFNCLLPVYSDVPTDRISEQIAVIRNLLTEMSKYLRWATIGIVFLAVMVGIVIAKQSR